jgi:pimeloyl-ACP methyl ester carboxylesterase
VTRRRDAVTRGGDAVTRDFDERSRWVEAGGPVHYLDLGGPAGAPVVVAVHGLGGSAVNWSAIAPLLTGACRLLAIDLAGHGLTESLGRRTTVGGNRVLLHRFIERVATRPVILMGNSMGGMISLLEAAAAADAVAGLVLLDPALPLRAAAQDPLVTAAFALYSMPGLGRFVINRRRAAAPDRQVDLILRLCCADPSRVAPAIRAEQIEMVRRRAGVAGAERDFLAAARSVVTASGPSLGRAYRAAMRAIRAPVLLVHGDRDRLVPVATARAAARANPAWELAVLPGVGHVPQLEAPAETAQTVLGWLGGPGRAAAAAAAHVLAGAGPR